MIDIFLCSADEAELRAYCAPFVNVIGPARGMGSGCGDPQKVYACLRVSSMPALSGSLTFCAPAEGQSVVGLWVADPVSA